MGTEHKLLRNDSVSILFNQEECSNHSYLTIKLTVPKSGEGTVTRCIWIKATCTYVWRMILSLQYKALHLSYTNSSINFGSHSSICKISWMNLKKEIDVSRRLALYSTVDKKTESFWMTFPNIVIIFTSDIANQMQVPGPQLK